MDVNGKKDEYGNYPVQTYHENYFKKQPFIIQDALQKLAVPVMEVENPLKCKDFEKALQKANLIPVTIMHNGTQTTGTLAINPGERRIDVYDKQMKLIQGQQQVAPAAEQQEEINRQVQPDEKKNFQPGNKVTWTQRNQYKGISR